MRPFVDLLLFSAAFLLLSSPLPATALLPYSSRSLWDYATLGAAGDLLDPFRVLEQTPFAVPKRLAAADDALALARADWKETPQAHIISLDVPGVKREDIKIEVEENRVLRMSGERKGEEEAEGERWHRVERSSGKFWMLASADMEGVKAHLEDCVLRVTVPKLRGETRPQPRLVNIVEENKGGEDIRASKSEM